MHAVEWYSIKISSWRLCNFSFDAQKSSPYIQIESKVCSPPRDENWNKIVRQIANGGNPINSLWACMMPGIHKTKRTVLIQFDADQCGYIQPTHTPLYALSAFFFISRSHERRWRWVRVASQCVYMICKDQRPNWWVSESTAAEVYKQQALYIWVFSSFPSDYFLRQMRSSVCHKSGDDLVVTSLVCRYRHRVSIAAVKNAWK